MRMKQEIIAGIVFCIMGLGMLLLAPGRLWRITEKWKTKEGGQPSDRYIVIMRILGAVFALTGGGLLIWGKK